VRMSNRDDSPASPAVTPVKTTACRKAVSEPSADAGCPSADAGCPSTVTRIATPRTTPTCRAIVTTPDPVAKRPGGIAATAALTSVGSVSPTPTPVISMPGSMCAG
jgi:hypothetical protein